MPHDHDDDEKPEVENPEEPEEPSEEIKATSHEIARRQLLGKMSIALGCAGGAALAVPIVGFIIAPLFGEQPREWRQIAGVEAFKIGETVNVVFVDASPL